MRSKRTEDATPKHIHLSFSPFFSPFFSFHSHTHLLQYIVSHSITQHSFSSLMSPSATTTTSSALPSLRNQPRHTPSLECRPPHKPLPLSESQLAALDTLRSQIQANESFSAKQKAWASDDTLVRYLKARKWNLQEAKQAVVESIQWRESYNPAKLDREGLWTEVKKKKKRKEKKKKAVRYHGARKNQDQRKQDRKDAGGFTIAKNTKNKKITDRTVSILFRRTWNRNNKRMVGKITNHLIMAFLILCT